MKKDLEFDALKKFWLTPPRVFDFETLRALKYSGDTGYLLELQKLYAGMFQEWDTLKKDVGTLMAAVAALDWRVVPYVEKGEKPSAKAQKVADVVSRAIWAKRKQKPGTYDHSFLQMVGAMVDGLLRGVSVHEMLLERLSDGTIAAPFYNMVFANYFIWENRDGKEDRLMLVRDGENFSDPEPFPENKFIIALNTQGSDHPMYNSVYSSLLGYFGAAKWGLPWLQEYCQRYGHDIKKFTVETDEQEHRLREQLAQADDITEVFLRAGEQMDVTPIPGAAGNPYETLMRLAEDHCHKAILGQTLTSDTSENGGSRAQAEVHMGVQKDVVLHYAEYVASVLNAQLIPALVELNFGKGELPMPELQFSIPDGGVSLETVNYWKAVLEIPGMRVAQEEIYESLRIPMPADGAAVFETPSAPAGFGGMMPHTHGTQTAPQGSKDNPQEDNGTDDDDDTDPPGGGGGKPGTDEGGDVDAARGEMSEDEKRLAAVDKLAAEGLRQWAAPTVEALQRMLDAGVPMASVLDRLDEMMPDTDALADSLTAAFRASLGVSEGDVAAAVQGKQFSDAEIQRYVDYYHASLTEDGDYCAGMFMRNHNIPDVPHEQVMAFLRRQKEQSANVEAENPYGCNGVEHKNGCPKGATGDNDRKSNENEDSKDVEYIIGQSYETPRTTPLELDSAPASIRPNDWAAQIGSGLSIKTPLQECYLSTDIESKDWAKYGDGEIEWRKRNLNYAIRTLKNPQEVWQGYKGNMVYVSKFKGEQDRVVIVVTHGNEVLTYYAEKKRPEKMNKYRKGKFLHKRKKAQR